MESSATLELDRWKIELKTRCGVKNAVSFRLKSDDHLDPIVAETWRYANRLRGVINRCCTQQKQGSPTSVKIENCNLQSILVYPLGSISRRVFGKRVNLEMVESRSEAKEEEIAR